MLESYNYATNTKVILQPDSETLVSIEGPVIKADWYDADEGLCGDYNPEDPSDIHLLRFDIYIKNGTEWEAVEDASYCTQVPFETDTNILIRLLYKIYKEYNNILSTDPDRSVKKLGEALSWISPYDVMI